MGTKILVVDDEPKFREGIAMYLKLEGYTILEAGTGKMALEMFRAHSPDLIILDVMLPDMNGFEVCRIIRQCSNLPIIFLTAMGDDEYYMLGYHSGADDYIEKPFRTSILAMKVAKILQKSAEPDHSIYQLGNLVIDTDGHTCTVDGAAVVLTQKEYDLLLEFIRRPGRLLTRRYLLQSVWNYLYEGETRVVDNSVSRLRKKIAAANVTIKTIIGVGYKMEEI